MDKIPVITEKIDTSGFEPENERSILRRLRAVAEFVKPCSISGEVKIPGSKFQVEEKSGGAKNTDVRCLNCPENTDVGAFCSIECSNAYFCDEEGISGKDTEEQESTDVNS